MPRPKKYESEEEPKQKILVIRRGGVKQMIPSWRFYSIVDILRDLGANHMDAQDKAKWAGRAPPGSKASINDISLEVIEQ